MPKRIPRDDLEIIVEQQRKQIVRQAHIIENQADAIKFYKDLLWHRPDVAMTIALERICESTERALEATYKHTPF